MTKSHFNLASAPHAQKSICAFQPHSKATPCYDMSPISRKVKKCLKTNDRFKKIENILYKLRHVLKKDRMLGSQFSNIICRKAPSMRNKLLI